MSAIAAVARRAGIPKFEQYRLGLPVFLVLFAGCIEKTTESVVADKRNPSAQSQEVERVPAESLQIERHRRYVKRKGEVLELKLLNGKMLELTNTHDPQANVDDTRSFTFVDYIEQIRYFVIGVTYWEDSGYLLVSAADGKMYSLDSAPVFSRKYDRLVTTSFCDHSCQRRIQVWRVIEGQVIAEGTIFPELSWARATASWESENRIRIQRELYQPFSADEPVSKTVYITKTAESWKLVGGR